MLACSTFQFHRLPPLISGFSTGSQLPHVPPTRVPTPAVVFLFSFLLLSYSPCSILSSHITSLLTGTYRCLMNISFDNNTMKAAAAQRPTTSKRAPAHPTCFFISHPVCTVYSIALNEWLLREIESIQRGDVYLNSYERLCVCEFRAIEAKRLSLAI